MSDTNYPRSLVDQSFGLCISPDDLIFPFYYQSGGNYYRPWKWFNQSGLKDSGSNIDEDEDIFKITLDVQHFKPNEINVKVSDREVIIQGNHKEKQDCHGFISRQFMRRYILPYNCLSETVECTLSSDGVLIITAKKALTLKQNNEISVPIQFNSTQTKSDYVEVKQTTAGQENILSKSADMIQSEIENKKGMQIMLKDEHCRLLKPEFLGPAILEANEQVNKDATFNLREEKIENASMSTNIFVENRSEEEAGKTYRSQLQQQTNTNVNREQETKAENVTIEQKISQKASEVIEGIKVSENILGSEAMELSQNQQLMDEQISQKASMIIGEIIRESSLNKNKDEKLSQNAYRTEETTEKTSFTEVEESKILQQSQDNENIQLHHRGENVKIKEEMLQKSSAVIEEATSSSSQSNTSEERIIQDSVSSELKEMSSVYKEKLENLITSEATSKIKECKEILEATPLMCTSMQASVSSTSAVQNSFEEISVGSTKVKVIDQGLKSDSILEEVIENSNTSCGLSGMNATIEEIIEKCNAEMADIASKIAESHMVSTSDQSNLSMSFKSSETQESSFSEESFSSVSSMKKGTIGEKSLLMHDVIAELKDASENM